MMLFIGVLVSVIVTLIVYSAYIILISFTLWMAVDAAKQDRLWWIVLIIGIPFVGSVVYYYTEKKHEYAKAESHHVHTSETEEQHEQAPKKKVIRKKAESKNTKTEEAQAVPETTVQLEGTHLAGIEGSQAEGMKKA